MCPIVTVSRWRSFRDIISDNVSETAPTRHLFFYQCCLTCMTVTDDFLSVVVAVKVIRLVCSFLFGDKRRLATCAIFSDMLNYERSEIYLKRRHSYCKVIGRLNTVLKIAKSNVNK